MEKVVLTEEMINDGMAKEFESGKGIDDKRERLALSDIVTEIETMVSEEYYRKGFEAGFNECLKLVGGVLDNDN